MEEDMLPEKDKPAVSIVKIGGNVVDNPETLKAFLSDFEKLPGRKLLVHGGGVMASKLSRQLGLEPKMLQGRRITDAETLKIVTMVYAGWINKSIVALLQKLGCNAIGLSGADGNIIPAKKRSPHPIDFGFAGDPEPERIGTEVLARLLESGLTPVICAITHDEAGSLLNTNADTIAYLMGTALSSTYTTRLYYCFEKEGVLKDVNDANTLIPSIDKPEYLTYRAAGVIADGMIPKMDNSFKSIEQGVSEVIILHAKNLLNGKGTRLVKGE
ncbi:acetylglutamate kinase [Limibacterium fermenti]|jgi:acetylglutamate kinase|uniref:acetylglutamate kinase n=1 Tax=Limibacterium fermenti TaxID=3229863 RepID=UPI000E9F228B|nr:acetylglutamate kinase [Porphyromonadaceae bacterium]